MNYHEQLVELRNQAKRVKAQNQFLREQVQDLKARYDNVKKELEIMSEVNKGISFDEINKEKQMLIAGENAYLKMQLVSTVTEKQYLQRSNEQLKEKINDLKYTNGELKALNEKLSSVHVKQVEIMRKQTVAANVHQENQKKLIKEKQNLEKKLQNCSIIVKQMEAYYVNELKRKSDACKAKEQQLRQIIREFQAFKSQFEKNQQCRQLEQTIKRQSQQKKYQLKVEQLKQKYQQQVSELKDNLKFLICKVEGMQQNSQSNIFMQTNPDSFLVQSKVLQSNTSNQSFRFTPNSSFTSSVKDTGNRRNSSIMKTPNKLSCSTNRNHGQRHYIGGALYDKTNQ